jgi:hypothetical protein
MKGWGFGPKVAGYRLPFQIGVLLRDAQYRKARLTLRLRTETTMSWKWIATRLAMGHWRSAANAVRLARK